MITDKTIFRLRGMLYCAFNVRDDYTGNDEVKIRKVREEAGQFQKFYYIKTPEGKKDLTRDVGYFFADEQEILKAKRWYHDTHQS